MPTTKTRINVSLPLAVHRGLAALARRDCVPRATKAARLLEIALELEEDQIWNTIASARDVPNARYLPHNRAWQ